MWPVIGAAAAGAVIVYEAVKEFWPKKKAKFVPGVLPPGPAAPSGPSGPTPPLPGPLPPPVPVAPHTVPGGGFVYTGPQAQPNVLMAAAQALAAVNPCDASNEQLVRNFQSAAGLAQINGGPGWDQVYPQGTDGRYGHDVAAVLSKYVAHAPAPCSPRPPWWGPPGKYYNNTAGAKRAA